jgi:hypothetical protein
MGFCSPAPTPFQRCLLRRLRGAGGMLYRSRWRSGAPEHGKRQAASGSGRFPRRRRLEASDLGFVELGVVPRPMCHKVDGFIFGEPLPRSIKLRISEGATPDLGPLGLRLLSFWWLLRRRERCEASDGEGHKDAHVPFC